MWEARLKSWRGSNPPPNPRHPDGLPEVGGGKLHSLARWLLKQGYSHYLELYQKEIMLFAPAGFKLPSWFRNNFWTEQPLLINSSMLPPESGLIDYHDKTFSVRISGLERAMMEYLWLSPAKFDLEEAWHIMEGLTSLVPSNVQYLLEQCMSVKVKRLFLYLAEKADHSWFKHLDIGKLNLGKGKRSIVHDGIYVSKYQITVPTSLI